MSICPKKRQRSRPKIGRLLLLIFFRHCLLQPIQILLVGMAEGAVKIFQHHGTPGAVLHGLVAVPHHLGHLALAHVGPNHLHAGGQILLHPAQDLLKVGGRTAKPGRAKEKHLLIGQTLEKVGRLLVAGTLVRPESHIDGVGTEGLGVRRAEVAALLLGQCLPDSLGQQGGVAGAAAVNDGIAHFVSFLS